MWWCTDLPRSNNHLTLSICSTVASCTVRTHFQPHCTGASATWGCLAVCRCCHFLRTAISSRHTLLRTRRPLNTWNAEHRLRTTLCSFWAAGANILLLTREPSSCLRWLEGWGERVARPHAVCVCSFPAHCWVWRYPSRLFLSPPPRVSVSAVRIPHSVA